MKKNWNFIITSALQQLNFRSEIWLWFVITSLPLLVLFLIWGAIYQDGANIPGFSYSQMITYYLIAFLFSIFTDTHFEEWRVQEIREGKIDMFLIRPFSYPRIVFFSFIGKKSIEIVFKTPFFILLVAVVSLLISESLSVNLYSNVLSIVILLIFSGLFNFCMGFGIVLLGFWFETAEGLEHFKWAAVAVLSGTILPLSLMPPNLQSIAMTLPFKYLQAVPAAILLGKYTLTTQDYVFMTLTLLLCWLVLLALWHKARYRYTSAGG